MHSIRGGGGGGSGRCEQIAWLAHSYVGYLGLCIFMLPGHPEGEGSLKLPQSPGFYPSLYMLLPRPLKPANSNPEFSELLFIVMPVNWRGASLNIHVLCPPLSLTSKIILNLFQSVSPLDLLLSWSVFVWCMQTLVLIDTDQMFALDPQLKYNKLSRGCLSVCHFEGNTHIS